MKRKRFGKFVLCLALAIVMCFGVMTAAFAAGPMTGGTEAKPLEAAITKRLDMPNDVATPAATFKFTVVRKSLNSSTVATEIAKMPDIGEKQIAFTAADANDIDSTDAIKSVAKQVNVFGGATFPTAGVYTYTIKETSDTYTKASNESMTYSGAEYEVSVYVANKATTGTYIQAIGALIKVTDNTTQTADTKVDATPKTNITSTDDTMVFTNTYAKTKTTDPENPDPETPGSYATKVTKEVTGSLGDRTKKFTFSINVAKPNIAACTATTCVGYVFNAEGTKGSAVTCTYGTAQTFDLAHGESFVLSDAYIGSTYTVSETAATGYTTKYTTVVGGTTVANAQTGTASGSLEIKTAENRVDFVNNFTDVTPTGIIMNNLPYFMLIVVALGAFVAFIIVMSRKKKSTANK